MKLTKLKIPAKDGFKLSAILSEPSTRSKAIIQINGGTGLPKELYAKLAQFLTESGYTTITFDNRGIGESRPSSLRGFKVRIKDWGQLDLPSVLDWIVQKYPNDSKIIIGHSMGGQLIGLMHNHAFIDQIVLISSGTGYWKDMSSPYKYTVAPLWYVVLPLLLPIVGYAPAKIFGQGENLPLGITKDWIRWSRCPEYFEVDLGRSVQPLFFDQINSPIVSLQIEDDPIANSTTSSKLLAYYKNADQTIIKIKPQDYQRQKIGHIGYFSQKSRDTLWPQLLHQLIFKQ